MSTLAAGVATVVLAALAVVQLLVASGRPLGRFVWGGQHRVLPRRLRVGSLVAVVLYLLFALLLWSRAGVLPGSETAFVRTATWLLAGYLVLGVALNAASRSRAERLTMTPVTAVLAAMTLLVALD